MDHPTLPPYAHHSNEESPMPGRRTPLGNVGLGGFYFQGGPSNLAGHSGPSDENNPDSSASGQLRYFFSSQIVTFFFLINFINIFLQFILLFL